MGRRPQITNNMSTYLISTSHLEDDVWFRDEEDFRTGMNTVATVQFNMGTVAVLAFILMSNHVHFVLEGRKRDVTTFVNKFKGSYSRHMRYKYGIKELLRRNDVDIRLLDGEESVERAIAYVLMNCVAANICLHPVQYPWGSGSCIFSENPARGIPATSLKKRELREMTHSKARFNNKYMVSNEGYILPESYVEVKKVESIFRTPKRMNYFLMSSSKSKQKMDEEPEVPAFRDQYVIAGIADICTSLFRKNGIRELNEGEMTELLRQLRYRFSCNIHQLARVAGLSYEEVVSRLDKV